MRLGLLSGAEEGLDRMGMDEGGRRHVPHARISDVDIAQS